MLHIIFSREAEEEVAEAYRWLLTFGAEVALNWSQQLEGRLEREAELLEAVDLRRPRAPDAPSSHDVRVMLFRTGKTWGSPWLIHYEVRDDDGDGVKDTLAIVRIHHAAGAP